MNWLPIETALDSIRDLEHLIEKSAGVCQWGQVLVWSEKTKDTDEGIYFAIYVELDNPKDCYWKDARRIEENYMLKPTHWMPIPEGPGVTS